MSFLVRSPRPCAGSTRSEGIADEPPEGRAGQPCAGVGFVALNLLGVNRPLWTSGTPRNSTGEIAGAMNRAVHGRRLASPVRLALASDLGASLDGAWWPHTASVADELPELVATLSARLGEIIAMSINWSACEGSPDFDALNRYVGRSDSGGVIIHHRLMRVTGRTACTSLLVVPCRTSNVLAIMVLRQAATLPITPMERDTREFRIGEYIVHTARAESAVCAQRLRNARLGHAATPEPVVTC
jgi:Family of unknown function (DUF5994)